MLEGVTVFASSIETSARTIHQMVAAGKGLRVAKSFAHVQAVAVVASS